MIHFAAGNYATTKGPRPGQTES